MVTHLAKGCAKAFQVYRREGLSGIKWRMLALQKNEAFGDGRWTYLHPIVNAVITACRWLDTSLLARSTPMRLLMGYTLASRRFRNGDMRFHLDKASPAFTIIRQDFIVSGWAVNLKTCMPIPVRVVLGDTIHHASVCDRPDVGRALATVCSLPEKIGFASAVRLPHPGLHRMLTQLRNAAGEWVTVHRTLAWCKPGSASTYHAWALQDQKRLEAQTPELKAHIGVMPHKPVFAVIVHGDPAAPMTAKTLAALQRQLYPHFHTHLAALQKNFAQAIAEADGDFILVLKSGQVLADHALYAFADEINKHPDADILYGDEDALDDEDLRHTPFYKPDWSPDTLETFNYIGFPACVRAALAQDCLAQGLYDLMLKATERTSRIRHIPQVLGHALPSRTHDAASDIAALEGRLARTGRSGTVSEHTLHKGCYDIRLSLVRAPLISIIIPTAGKVIAIDDRRLDLIANVIEQIRNRSTYTQIEIIVVDNGDLTQAQTDMLAQAGCRRVTYRDPAFNIAKKLNLGVAEARGELLLLMNDDIEIITPSWLERMMEHFEKPHVGAVGAKLLYPDGGLQHIGVVLNGGNPEHIRRHFATRDEAGYFFSTCGVRNYLAVTGACMMTPAALYRAAGGYSEALAMNYNDIDYCLKLGELGYATVYAPRAELIHMESVSRPPVMDPAEQEWFQARWASLASDPFYNEACLSVLPPTFIPSINTKRV